MSDAAPPYDAEFRAAFRYLLDERGWTATELCDRTRLTEGSPRRVSPSSVSDWLNRRKHPSNQAVMVVCEAFEVPRSYFFQVGEDLERARRERSFQALDVAANDLGAARQAMHQLHATIGALKRLLGPSRSEVDDGEA